MTLPEYRPTIKEIEESHLFDQIIREAVEHRTLHKIYYEAGYRDGVRDTLKEIK